MQREWGKNNAYRLLVRKAEGKRPLGRRRRSWVDNIKMDILDIEWGGVDCIGLAQDRKKWKVLVNNEPLDFIKCWETIKCLHSWWPHE
jgi:hypothetical protein